jgi:hypothetical protein
VAPGGSGPARPPRWSPRWRPERRRRSGAPARLWRWDAPSMPPRRCGRPTLVVQSAASPPATRIVLFVHFCVRQSIIVDPCAVAVLDYTAEWTKFQPRWRENDWYFPAVRGRVQARHRARGVTNWEQGSCQGGVGEGAEYDRRNKYDLRLAPARSGWHMPGGQKYGNAYKIGH